MESEAIVTSRCGRRAALGSAGAVAWMVLIVAIAHVGHAPRLPRPSKQLPPSSCASHGGARRLTAA